MCNVPGTPRCTHMKGSVAESDWVENQWYDTTPFKGREREDKQVAQRKDEPWGVRGHVVMKCGS